LSEGNNEYLAIGIVDGLITSMGKLQDLHVRPTSAVLKYANTKDDPTKIDGELKVKYLIEGSIRWSGERLRVTVQLVRIPEERLLWSERFDEEYSDPLLVEDSICEKVIRGLMILLKMRIKGKGANPADVVELGCETRKSTHTSLSLGLRRLR